MSRRFGPPSAKQSQQTKLLILVGGFLSVILLLIIGIVLVAGKSESTTPVQPVISSSGSLDPTSSGLSTTGAASYEVLIASRRIEEGAQFTADMFSTTAMEADRAPMGVIHAENRDLVIGKFSKHIINVSMPILREDVSEAPPINTIQIPPGYRASTITVDSRSGVEGFAKPNSRVDVIWNYEKQGKMQVATIARFVKVLSVAGQTQAGPDRAAVSEKTTVTLLVTERDAKKLELARTLGTISLTLVGEQETGISSSGEPDAVTIDDLVGRPAEAKPQELPNDGVMYTKDPKTGKQVRYVLRNGRWRIDSDQAE